MQSRICTVAVIRKRSFCQLLVERMQGSSSFSYLGLNVWFFLKKISKKSDVCTLIIKVLIPTINSAMFSEKGAIEKVKLGVYFKPIQAIKLIQKPWIHLIKKSFSMFWLLFSIEIYSTLSERVISSNISSVLSFFVIAIYV